MHKYDHVVITANIPTKESTYNQMSKSDIEKISVTMEEERKQ